MFTEAQQIFVVEKSLFPCRETKSKSEGGETQNRFLWGYALISVCTDAQSRFMSAKREPIYVYGSTTDFCGVEEPISV
jgi:hypothetical protein